MRACTSQNGGTNPTSSLARDRSSPTRHTGAPSNTAERSPAPRICGTSASPDSPAQHSSGSRSSPRTLRLQPEDIPRSLERRDENRVQSPVATFVRRGEPGSRHRTRSIPAHRAGEPTHAQAPEVQRRVDDRPVRAHVAIRVVVHPDRCSPVPAELPLVPEARRYVVVAVRARIEMLRKPVHHQPVPGTGESTHEKSRQNGKQNQRTPANQSSHPANSTTINHSATRVNRPVSRIRRATPSTVLERVSYARLPAGARYRRAWARTLRRTLSIRNYFASPGRLRRPTANATGRGPVLVSPAGCVAQNASERVQKFSKFFRGGKERSPINRPGVDLGCRVGVAWPPRSSVSARFVPHLLRHTLTR